MSWTSCTLSVLLCLPSLPALATSVSGDAADTQASESIVMSPELLMAGLANNHPDLYYRRSALEDLKQERLHNRGVRKLKHAARFSDKPAQAMVAEILWHGSHGQAQDRPAAYAWMDLAAERGYPELVRQRERYWDALSPQERSQALMAGQAIYARYGDDVAKPRLAGHLRRGSRGQLGGRTGNGTFITILAPAPGSSGIKRAGASPDFEGDQMAPTVTIAGHEYYDPKYWRPELYFQHQDRTWHVGVTEQKLGTADVGPLVPVKK